MSFIDDFREKITVKRTINDDYLKECLRLYEKYHMGKDVQEYQQKLINREIVDIPFVEMSVTTKCNLKCKHCSNLIPYLPVQQHFPLESNKKHLDQLLKKVHWIYRLKIHGGEPLYYPWLKDFLTYALEKPQIIDVRISTNGSVIPEPLLLKVMQNEKFVLHISSYPFMNDKVKRLLDTLEKNHIRYYYMEGQKWCDLGDYRVERNRSAEKTKRVIAGCNMRKCTSYYNGRIYVCSRAANLAVISGKDDGLQISEKNMKAELRDFFEQTYFEACKYCDGILPDSPLIPAGIQRKEKADV